MVRGIGDGANGGGSDSHCGKSWPHKAHEWLPDWDHALYESCPGSPLQEAAEDDNPLGLSADQLEQLRGMTAFLTPAPSSCSRKECDEAAAWRPIILLYPLNHPAYDGPPIRAAIGIAVCDGHKEETTLDQLVTADAFQMIRGGLLNAGKDEPDPERIGLDWEEVL